MKSNLRNEIKSYIVRQGMTMQEVVDLLRDEHGWSDSVSNLSNKLQRESLRYTEAVQLADALGYEIIWQKHLTPDQSFLTGIIVPHSIVVIEDVGTAQICRSCNGRPPRSPADHLGF